MRPDLILIPSAYRSEFLWLVLEHIAQAEGGKEKEIWISQDRRAKDDARQLADLPDIEATVRAFQNSFSGLHYSEHKAHHPNGNMSNFLELYKKAFNTTDVRYVYLIEDDVLVSKDFFGWHEAMQGRKPYFCTIGWHCIRNPKVKASNDATAYIESRVDYSSIGVCWKREKLETIVRHANEAYYTQMNVYLRQIFPNSPIPWNQWGEQAGMILRVLLDRPDLTAWPSAPRCAHIGIHGYHRRAGFRFGGNLETRVRLLREASKTTEGLMKLCRDPFDDVAA